MQYKTKTHKIHTDKAGHRARLVEGTFTSTDCDRWMLAGSHRISDSEIHA